MAYDIGPRVGVDGESEYRKSISRIRESIKTLGAEMDVVTTSYLNNDKTVESLSKEHEILERQISLTSEKLTQQSIMAGKTAAKYGETAEETQKWKRALAESQSELNKLKSKLSGVDGEMDDLGDSTDEVEENLKDAGDAGLKFGDVLKANVLSDAITGGIRALGSAIKSAVSSLADFAKSGVEVASDLDEVQNVVDVTFGTDGAAKIETFARKAAGAFGMSELSAKEFTGTMGAMLKSMGLSDDAVLDMSTDLVGLAGDLASFYNLDVDEAFAKIRSGISGETEPLKQLGINMSVANLEAYAMAQGIKTAYKNMTQAEQATLRYNYLIQATADAQGDFARTSGSYSNQQKVMQLNVENLSASIGTKLLPYLTDLTGALNGLLSGEKDIDDFVSEIGGMVGEIADEIVDGLPKLMRTGGKIVKSLLDGVQELLPDVAAAAGDVLGELLGGLLDGLPEFAAAGVKMLTTLVDGFAEDLPDLIPTVVDAALDLVEALTDPEVLVSLAEAALELIKGLGKGLINAIPDLLGSVPVIIGNLIESLLGFCADMFGVGEEYSKALGDGMDSESSIRSLTSKVGNITRTLAQLMIDCSDLYFKPIGKGWISSIWAGIKEAFSDLWQGLKTLFSGEFAPEKFDVFRPKGENALLDWVDYADRRATDYNRDETNGTAGAGSTSVPSGGGMTSTDLRNAMSGMAVYLDGRKVGTMVSIYQKGQSRASGVPVTLG